MPPRKAGLKRTPMARGKGLAKRSKPLPQRRAEPRRTAVSAIGPPSVDEWTRDALFARCKGLCEACGKALNRQRFDAHHRQRRRGGDHRLCNLVALHPACHTVQPDSVHQNPKRSRDLGLIVRSTEEPADAVLTLPSGRRVLLDPLWPQYRDVA
jgi:hypothetical protein